MQTHAAGPGRFTQFDLQRVPSPCFVIDEFVIEQNVQVLADIASQSNAHILQALKAFSLPTLAPLISQYLHGTCASGLFEAQLAKQFYTGEIATYCAAYKEADMPKIIAFSDHLIFNSLAQKDRFMAMVNAAANSPDIGLRINPLHSEGEVEKYDPCAPCSRLGIPISGLTDADLTGVSGLHMHTLCEQGFEPLERTWNAMLPNLEPLLTQLKWINFGGGHHITRADYNRTALVQFIKRIQTQYKIEVYLEPGEAVALDAGILVGEILDTTYNEMHLAITDVSATCHMPDVIEAPYRPQLMHEADNTGELYRLGGPSCLAGDIIGDYRFSATPAIGQRIAFLDQAHYSLVKTNTFNGVPLPAIALWNSQTDDLRMIREFDYTDFLNRLHA